MTLVFFFFLFSLRRLIKHQHTSRALIQSCYLYWSAISSPCAYLMRSSGVIPPSYFTSSGATTGLISPMLKYVEDDLKDYMPSLCLIKLSLNWRAEWVTPTVTSNYEALYSLFSMICTVCLFISKRNLEGQGQLALLSRWSCNKETGV